MTEFKAITTKEIRRENRDNMISYIGARIVGTAYLQGIDHASIPWPMVSDKGGGKIVPATPSEIYFASQLERREKGKRVIISYTWEKGHIIMTISSL